MMATGQLESICLFVFTLTLLSSSQGKSESCSASFLDTLPFFRMPPARFQSQQILFLTEFSRFMNKQAPRFLKDFVEKKKIYQAEKTLQKLKRYDLTSWTTAEEENNMPEAKDISGGESFASWMSDSVQPRQGLEEVSQELMYSLMESTQEAIKMAKDIVKAVEHSADKHDFSTPDFWEAACKSEWWPFDDRTCIEIRCTACAPAIMSAAAVCDIYKKHRDADLSFSCMQKVMSEGFCNFCIAEYIEEIYYYK